ncbi:MAG: sigma-70 family RNA polymerase sigma factor [Ruminococcaceae bacterium]|nr:sigma-70 family RNA polymerase sigma factor [Oscillospiraceae bacterium]
MCEAENRQARHYELLTEARSADAAVAAAATDLLLKENIGLVRSAAFKFRDRGIEYEDLMQIGIMGMLRAIRTFDLSRGTAFSTFAVPLIVGEIRRSLRDDGMIHVSRAYKQLAGELSRRRRELTAERGEEPTLAELAELCHTTPEEAATALAAVAPVTSLSEKLFEEDKGELQDRLTDEESENEPVILTNRLALGEAIGRMPPLWRKILLLRYFRGRTQQETADLLGLSQVKVSREEKKILTYLRGEMIV